MVRSGLYAPLRMIIMHGVRRVNDVVDLGGGFIQVLKRPTAELRHGALPAEWLERRKAEHQNSSLHNQSVGR